MAGGKPANSQTQKFRTADRSIPAMGKTLSREFATCVEWLVVSRDKNKSKLASHRTFPRFAALISVCCLAIGSLLPIQAEPTVATSSATFSADATTPAFLIQLQANEPGVSLPFPADFGQGRSFALLKGDPQADKSAGFLDINAGYGQFFSGQNRVRPSTNRIEAPGRLFLKFSFKF
jgi:hypothetical protein